MEKNLDYYLLKVSKKHKYSLKSVKKRITETYVDLRKSPKYGFFLENFKPKKGDIVVDVGCYIGTYIHVLARKYPNTKFIGYDLSKEFIDAANEIAKDTPNCTFHCKDVFKSGMKKSSVDYLFFTEVLEHVDSPKQYLENFHSLLKTGGKLYLSTPAALGLTNIFLNIKNRSMKYIEKEERDTGTEKDHIYIWDKLILFRLLNRSGFKFIKYHLSNRFKIFGGQSLCFIVKK